MRAMVFAAAALLANAAPADACAPPPCWPGAFVPGTDAHVPANLPGIVWRPLRDYANQAAPDPAMVSLKTDGNAIALTATPQADGSFILAPTLALTPGKTYVLHDATACSYGALFATPDATFTATPTAPLPSGLGSTTATIDERDLVNLGTASGTCAVEADVDAVTIALSASSDAQPWRDVLMFATKVDGVAWSALGPINGTPDPGASWTGRGTDRVYEVCNGGDLGSQPGVTAGLHEAALEATLANTTVAIAASPVTFSVMCSNFIPNDDTAGGGDAGFPIDNVGQRGGGCLSASPAAPGFFTIALLFGLRRRKKTKELS